jgi:hypothetical protein
VGDPKDEVDIDDFENDEIDDPEDFDFLLEDEEEIEVDELDYEDNEEYDY